MIADVACINKIHTGQYMSTKHGNSSQNQIWTAEAEIKCNSSISPIVKNYMSDRKELNSQNVQVCPWRKVETEMSVKKALVAFE